MLLSTICLSTLPIALIISLIPSTFGHDIEVTNEQLHNTLVTLVTTLSLLEDKLRRQEQRDRSVAEILKRSVKKIQSAQINMMSTFTERFSHIDSALLTHDEHMAKVMGVKFNSNEFGGVQNFEKNPFLMEMSNELFTERKPVDDKLVDAKHLQWLKSIPESTQDTNKNSVIPTKLERKFVSKESLKQLNQNMSDEIAQKIEIQELTATLNTPIMEILQKTTELSKQYELNRVSLQKNYEILNKNVSTIESTMFQIPTELQFIRQEMKLNVQSITQQFEELMSANFKELNRTIFDEFNTRFNSLNNSISSSLQNVDLIGLTSKIDNELKKVWRELDILTKDLSSSKLTVQKLQEQIMVDGQLPINADRSVAQMMRRITQIDTKFNSILKELSLVTEEFNQIKTGLSSFEQSEQSKDYN